MDICRFCLKETNKWAGNPNEWPVRLGNNYVVHVGCVREKITILENIGAKLASLGIVADSKDFVDAIDKLVK